jgi:hypothetical protein
MTGIKKDLDFTHDGPGPPQCQLSGVMMVVLVFNLTARDNFKLANNISLKITLAKPD